MDALDVLRKAEEMGGSERKDAMLKTLTTARKYGCTYNTGGGKVGGFNIRYGSLNFAVMDVNCEGTIYLHIKSHPGKPITDEQRADYNKYITGLEGIEIKNGPIHHYGQVVAGVEEIPFDSIEAFLQYSVENITTNYY